MPRIEPKHRSIRHPAVAAGLVALVMTVYPLGGCGSESASNGDESIDFAMAQVRTFEISTLASGELEARDRVELRSEVERQTTIVEIKDEGDRVEAGDVLVRLSSDEIKREIEEEELQVAEATLQLEAAETAYDIQVSDNAANLRKAQLKVDLARLALDQWDNGDKVKKIKELVTAIEKASRDLDRLREKKVKSDELYKKEFISYDEWKRDEIALLEAEARFETTKLDKEVYETYQVKRDGEQKRSDLGEAEQELARVRKSNEINLKNRDSARQNRSVQLNRRQERLTEYRTQFDACIIKAPKAGLVVYGSTAQPNNWRWQSEGPISIGRQIRNNDLLITLPDTSEMMASVKVHESMAGRVHKGQEALITIEAAGGLVLNGTVESIGLLAEGGGWRDPNRREYTVRVAVESGESSQQLKPSMRCQVEIILGTVEDAVSVPVQAVFSDGPVRYVLTPDGARFDRRPVQLGRRSDMFAQIDSGIEVDESVLIREPRPGEINDVPWDTQQLTDAGYTLDEDGNPLAGGGGSGKNGPRGPRGQRGKKSQSSEDKAEGSDAPEPSTESAEAIESETESIAEVDEDSESAAPTPEPEPEPEAEKKAEPTDPAG